MSITMSPADIYTRDGLLDEIMERCFDAALLMDPELHIIHISSSGARYLGAPSQKDVVGKIIPGEEARARFSKVLRSGETLPHQLTDLYGSASVLSIHPVVWKGEVIAALGTVLHRNLGEIKNILSAMQAGSSGSQDTYDFVSRIAPAARMSDFVGQSRIIRDMLAECDRIAQTHHPVLITGETGTGKEILAGIIHSRGNRTSLAPYVSVNCSAIPEALLESELFGHVKGAYTGAFADKKGKFELAAGGSLLLDEIADMAVSLQAKLLRVLECREFEKVGGTSMQPLNARVIAATNSDMRQRCAAGTFRPDLYYRLNTFEIFIPPLRERVEDIPLLVEHFVRLENITAEFGDDALNVMMEYNWPGNVRQLKSIVLRLGARRSQYRITGDDVRATLHGGGTICPAAPKSAAQLRRHGEQARLEGELTRNNYNISKTARHLGISRTTLYKRMRDYGIGVNE